MKLEKDIFVDYRCINGKKYISKDNQIYQLDEIGEKIWESLDGKTSIEEIIDEVSRVYVVERDVVSKDIKAYIDDLLSKELVSVVGN
ncbi:hypothetical protein AN1V17_39480 [Vallitalea sediminicola]